MGQLLDELRLLAGGDILGFDMIVGSSPILTKTHFIGSLLSFPIAPLKFFFGNGKQFLRRVINHFMIQCLKQGLPADGIPNHGRILTLNETGMLFSNPLGIGFECLHDLLVRKPGPPGEGGVVTLVKFKPFPQRASMKIDGFSQTHCQHG